jgi:hypothetical protein
MQSYYFKSETMETVYETITRLKFIGMVKPGEKIFVNNDLSISSTNIITWLIRKIYYENGKKTLEFLVSTVNRSFEIIQLNLLSDKSSDRAICKNLIKDLRDSRKGFINIKKTYENDLIVSCRIQTLIDSIDSNLRDLYENHSYLFPTEEDKNFQSNDEIKFN